MHIISFSKRVGTGDNYMEDVCIWGGGGGRGPSSMSPITFFFQEHCLIDDIIHV